ncbi:heparinase II/III domain-containing protein [Neoroseomonas lacus]|uniref:Heparinase II/III-like C-terminal domain-containing protein n=1 Tax=Neoroseomonas lacus TaxID=287609 RepID=A0A917KXE5_9PROT|nr:heparinase II/III family protein [Neoroseomonas lacus]GGJ34443.1 hypothetical protein GCM10011320_47730 [Neoroseomonas lacus]
MPALTESVTLAEAAVPAVRGDGAWVRVSPRFWLLADAAWRLGPRACLLAGWHRAWRRSGLAARALRDVALPDGPFLPHRLSEAVGQGDAAALAAAAEVALAPGWHGAFPADVPSLGLDLFSAGDIRPVWEANRLLALPLLAKAARLAPGGGHLARAEAVLRDWAEANPSYRGPAWACGQEAALRAVHLCLALALLEADRAPAPAMRALLGVHARRIAATRAYAAAQDNNHVISELAGLFVIGLVLGDAALARRGARGLARAVTRLVAPDGAFAQASPGYHRLLLDTLVVAEWFRRRHGAPAFAAPFADRAAAATRWLDRVMDPRTGALPRCGPVDDSALADLSLHGALDARGSVGRAAALFLPDVGFDDADAPPRLAPGGVSESPTVALDVGRDDADAPPCPRPTGGVQRPLGLWWGGPEGRRPSGGAPLAWRSEGWLGLRTPRFQALLRTGAPLRFRPSQADLLHLDLALDGAPLLTDGGTGAYNPPSGFSWWTEVLAGTAGHNTVQFDDEDQMPRVGRFLFARWPRCVAVPGGATMRDARSRRHERRLHATTHSVVIEDEVAGPFAGLVLRWRLAPGAWRVTADGAQGPRARLRLAADAPCRIRLASGWHSPAYGRVDPATVLELAAVAPVSRLTTVVEAG